MIYTEDTPIYRGNKVRYEPWVTNKEQVVPTGTIGIVKELHETFYSHWAIVDFEMFGTFSVDSDNLQRIA